MYAVLTCASATNTRVELRLLGGDPSNADYGSAADVLVFAGGGHPFLVDGHYGLTISPLPGPGGTPMRRAKLACVSANTLPNGQFQATLRMVTGDPLNAGLTADNLVLTVISSQQFTVGTQYIVDLDPA